MPRALGDEGDYKNVIRLTVSGHPAAFQDGIILGDVTRQSIGSSGLRWRDVHAGSGVGIEWGLAIRSHDYTAVTRM